MYKSEYSGVFGDYSSYSAEYDELTEDAEYEPVRDALSLAGLDERKQRRMKPDDRMAALERAKLDPYDYIYLACG